MRFFTAGSSRALRTGVDLVHHILGQALGPHDAVVGHAVHRLQAQFLKVGTLGRAATRWGAATTMGTSRFSLMKGSAEGRLSKSWAPGPPRCRSGPGPDAAVGDGSQRCPRGSCTAHLQVADAARAGRRSTNTCAGRLLEFRHERLVVPGPGAWATAMMLGVAANVDDGREVRQRPVRRLGVDGRLAAVVEPWPRPACSRRPWRATEFSPHPPRWPPPAFVHDHALARFSQGSDETRAMMSVVPPGANRTNRGSPCWVALNDSRSSCGSQYGQRKPLTTMHGNLLAG